jgi:hypothetical protein
VVGGQRDGDSTSRDICGEVVEEENERKRIARRLGQLRRKIGALDGGWMSLQHGLHHPQEDGDGGVGGDESSTA